MAVTNPFSSIKFLPKGRMKRCSEQLSGIARDFCSGIQQVRSGYRVCELLFGCQMKRSHLLHFHRRIRGGKLPKRGRLDQVLSAAVALFYGFPLNAMDHLLKDLIIIKMTFNSICVPRASSE